MGQGVLAETANAKAVPTASVAKLMVALAVLQKQPLRLGQSGPMITVRQADVDSYNTYLAENGSVVQVTVGQQVSEYQALQAMLLPSANNIAEMLAVWAYGSLPAYLEAANQLSQDIGLLGSHFADASGFAPETVSTPRDLVLLGQKALSQPVLKQIFAQPTAQFPGVGTIVNTNYMLGTDGIIGIKTGNTDQAGGCYLFAAQHQLPNKQQITAVGAIMGAPSLYQALVAAPPLLDSFYQGFGPQTAVHKGQAIVSYRTAWGQTVQAVAAKDLTIYGWQGANAQLSVRTAKLQVPANAGTAAGTVTATTAYGRASVQLVLRTAVKGPSWDWRLFRR
jgi:D-alanyl-D-alanine carboxypeptidase (penicillin-binding protein 5/6)